VIAVEPIMIKEGAEPLRIGVFIAHCQAQAAPWINIFKKSICKL